MEFMLFDHAPLPQELDTAAPMLQGNSLLTNLAAIILQFGIGILVCWLGVYWM